MTRPTIIVAVASNGVIGRTGALPWDIPEERRHFARTTRGGVVILGRRTWESIPGGLPGREVIVLTRTARYCTDCRRQDGSIPVASLRKAINHANDCWPDKPAYIAGGAEVYAEALHVADRMILSKICVPVEGDTAFPDWSQFRWDEQVGAWELSEMKWQTPTRDQNPWRIETWKRKPEPEPAE